MNSTLFVKSAILTVRHFRWRLSTVTRSWLLRASQWEYEREWRMLIPLSGATRSVPVVGDTVHLFALPPTALTGIILGARANFETETAVRNAISRRPELRHVRLTRAILNLG